MTRREWQAWYQIIYDQLQSLRPAENEALVPIEKKSPITTDDVIAAHDYLKQSGLRLKDIGVGARWWKMTAQCAKHGLLVRYEEAETPPARIYVHCLPCKNETGRDRECEVRDTDLYVGQPPLLFGGGDLGPSD